MPASEKRLDPKLVRRGLEGQQSFGLPRSPYGAEVYHLIERILDQSGGVEHLCELYQPVEKTTDHA